MPAARSSLTARMEVSFYPVRDSGYCQCVFSVGKPDDGLCFHCQPGGLFLKGLTDGNPVLFQQFPVSGEVGPALSPVLSRLFR